MIAALALVVLFSLGLAWVFTRIGLIMRAPNAVLNTGFMALFPLLFLSNAFVPPDTLPRGLKAFVDVNPVSQLVTAARELMNGTASVGEVAIPLAIAAGITAVFLPLTVRLYRTRG